MNSILYDILSSIRYPIYLYDILPVFLYLSLLFYPIPSIPTGTNLQCKYYPSPNDPAIGKCDCPPPPPQTCESITSNERCKRSNCPSTNDRCVWNSDTGCQCPPPPICSGYTNSDLCIRNVCPGTNEKCQWNRDPNDPTGAGKCDCPPPPPQNCEDLKDKDSCTLTACPGIYNTIVYIYIDIVSTQFFKT